MGLDKLPTSQDHSIGKVTDLAAQPFLEREFALLLVNDRFGFGPVKCRWVVLAPKCAAKEQMLAILCGDLLRVGCSPAAPE